jgi:hypothetical protein
MIRVALIAAGLLAGAACGGEAPRPILPVSGRVATVVVFVGADCPVSNRYAPEILRLRDRFRAAGVEFLAVYPDARAAGEALRAHRREYLPDLPVLRDADRKLAAACRVSVTPEAAVFTPAGALVYHGRIDDRFADVGVMRPQPTKRDLEEVLEAMAKGTTPPVASAPAVGCPIAP